MCLNGRNVEKEIRTHEVSRHVSIIAKVSAVRNKLVKSQQQMAASSGVVMDGRDIGTVVLPDAELKFFMTASLEARTRRRMPNCKRGRIVSAEEVEANLTQRDHIDSTRDHGPFNRRTTPLVIDNSDLSIEQFEHMMALVQEHAEWLRPLVPSCSSSHLVCRLYGHRHTIGASLPTHPLPSSKATQRPPWRRWTASTWRRGSPR